MITVFLFSGTVLRTCRLNTLTLFFPDVNTCVSTDFTRRFSEKSYEDAGLRKEAPVWRCWKRKRPHAKVCIDEHILQLFHRFQFLPLILTPNYEFSNAVTL